MWKHWEHQKLSWRMLHWRLVILCGYSGTSVKLFFKEHDYGETGLLVYNNYNSFTSIAKCKKIKVLFGMIGALQLTDFLASTDLNHQKLNFHTYSFIACYKITLNLNWVAFLNAQSLSTFWVTKSVCLSVCPSVVDFLVWII